MMKLLVEVLKSSHLDQKKERFEAFFFVLYGFMKGKRFRVSGFINHQRATLPKEPKSRLAVLAPNALNTFTIVE